MILVTIPLVQAPFGHKEILLVRDVYFFQVSIAFCLMRCSSGTSLGSYYNIL